MASIGDSAHVSLTHTNDELLQSIARLANTSAILGLSRLGRSATSQGHHRTGHPDFSAQSRTARSSDAQGTKASNQSRLVTALHVE